MAAAAKKAGANENEIRRAWMHACITRMTGKAFTVFISER